MSGVTYVDHVPLGTEVSGRIIAGGTPILDFGGVRIGLSGHPDPIEWLSRLIHEATALRTEIAERQAVTP